MEKLIKEILKRINFFRNSRNVKHIYICIFIKGIPLIDDEQNGNNSSDQT